jgi:hypothetical protein
MILKVIRKTALEGWVLMQFNEKYPACFAPNCIAGTRVWVEYPGIDEIVKITIFFYNSFT